MRKNTRLLVIIFFIFVIYFIFICIKEVNLIKNRSTNAEKFLLPQTIKTEEGLVKVNKIFIRKEKTTYGYSGILSVGFDFSDMDENQRYWFEKKYNIYIRENVMKNYFEGANRIELEKFYYRESIIYENGEKFFFYYIKESETPIEELYLCLEIKIKKEYLEEYKIEIEEKISEFEIAEKFPEYMDKIYRESFLK